MGAPVQGSRHIWQKAPLLQKLCWPPFHFCNKLNSNTMHSFKRKTKVSIYSSDFWTQFCSKMKCCKVFSNRAMLRTPMSNLPVFWYYNHDHERVPDPDYDHRNYNDHELPKTTKTPLRLQNYNGTAVLNSCWCLIDKALTQHFRRDFLFNWMLTIWGPNAKLKAFLALVTPVLLSHSLTLVNPFLFSFNAARFLGGQFKSVWTLLNWTLTFPFVTRPSRFTVSFWSHLRLSQPARRGLHWAEVLLSVKLPLLL